MYANDVSLIYAIASHAREPSRCHAIRESYALGTHIVFARHYVTPHESCHMIDKDNSELRFMRNKSMYGRGTLIETVIRNGVRRKVPSKPFHGMGGMDVLLFNRPLLDPL